VVRVTLGPFGRRCVDDVKEDVNKF
jgi:hypothetical protein